MTCVFGATAASALDNVSVCTTGGTNAPYTASNPLICSNFTFAAGVANATVEKKPDSLVSFTGGTHWIYGKFSSPRDQNKYSMTGEIVITGPKTVVNANEVEFKNNQAAATQIKTVDGEPFKTVLRIEDGAKLSVGKCFRLYPSLAYDQYVYLDHATLEMRNEMFYDAPLKTDCIGWLSFERGEHGTNYLIAVDSEIHSPSGTVYFTSPYGYYNNYSGAEIVRCTNTVFHVGKFSFSDGTGDAEFHNCTFANDDRATCYLSIGAGAKNPSDPEHTPVPKVLLKDCTCPHFSLDVGWLNSEEYPERMSHVTIDGGVVHFDKLDIGRSYDGKRLGPGRVTLKNAEVALGYAGQAVGNSVTGILDVVGTRLIVTNNLLLGSVDGSFATAESLTGGGFLNISEGSEVSVYLTPTADQQWGMGAGNVYVGYGAPATLNLVNSSLSARFITLGSPRSEKYDVSAAEYVFHQTGGVVTNYIGDGHGGTIVAQQATAHAKLIIEDGEYRTLSVRGGAGVSTFLANGATLVATKDLYRSVYNFIDNLTTAQIGARGLTVDIEVDGAVVNQEFTNLPGEAGVFRKVGSYPLTLTFPHASTWDVATTRVEEGALVLGGTDETMATALFLTDGTTLSMEGSATQLTVNSLNMKGATLRVDAGDRIVVTGEATFEDLTFEVAEDPVDSTTNDLLVVTTPLSADSLRELRNAVADFVNRAGQTHRALVETSGGQTLVRLAISNPNEPLATETTWKGTSSGLWNDAANGWTAGVPAAGVRAFFPSGPVSRSVTVPGGATAGALAFDEDAYKLSGSTLSLSAPYGSLRVTTEPDAATATVSAPLAITDDLTVHAASGTVVKLAGSFAGGGFFKRGAGTLVLSGDNQFEYATDCRTGTVEIANAKALGCASGSRVKPVRVACSTLRFRASDKKETVLDRGILVNTYSNYLSGIIRTDTPVRTPLLASEMGGIIKRGTAPLTVEVAEDYSILAVDPSASDYCQGLFHFFPADGAGLANSGKAGADQFLGLSVAEGELCFRAAAGVATRPTVTENKDAITIGLHTTNMDAVARFRLENVCFDAHNKDFYNNGFNNGNHYAQPYVIQSHWLSSETHLQDDALLHVNSFYANHYSSNGKSRPTVSVTNSTLRAETQFWFTHAGVAKASVASTAIATFRAETASLVSPVFVGQGGLDVDLSNTYVGPADSSQYTSLHLVGPAFGTLAFRNGTVLRLDDLSFAKFKISTAEYVALDTRYPLTLVFDGATWLCGPGDHAFETASCTTPSYVSTSITGAGLTLCPQTNTTFTVSHPFVGDGTFTVDGPGTVTFASDAFQLTGKIAAKAGVLDLTDVGLLTGTVIGSGAGTIRGGKFYNATIALDEQNGPVPNFENCSFSGTTLVTIGGELTRADDVLIGTYTGEFGDITTFKFPKRDGFRGENFRAADGKILFRLASRLGLMVIIHH